MRFLHFSRATDGLALTVNPAHVGMITPGDRQGTVNLWIAGAVYPVTGDADSVARLLERAANE